MSPKSQPVATKVKRVARERLRRENDILAVARELVAREGIAGFSTERVAEEAGYSRTAIYRYFPSKEELILALAVETAALRSKLWERIEDFDARPRERMVAMGEVTAFLYPRHVLPQVVALSNAVRAKTTRERQKKLRALDREDHRISIGIVRSAIKAGDLTLPRGISDEELLFGINAFVRGLFLSIAIASPIGEVGITDPRRVMRALGREFLDGMGWRPLSGEWDYRATMRRIYTELYPPEYLASLGLRIDDRTAAVLRTARA